MCLNVFPLANHYSQPDSLKSKRGKKLHVRHLYPSICIHSLHSYIIAIFISLLFVYIICSIIRCTNGLRFTVHVPRPFTHSHTVLPFTALLPSQSSTSGRAIRGNLVTLWSVDWGKRRSHRQPSG